MRNTVARLGSRALWISRDDPFANRTDGSGLALGGKPIELIELFFSERRRCIQQTEQPVQSFSPGALPDETAPDGFVLVELANVFLNVVEGRIHSATILF